MILCVKTLFIRKRKGLNEKLFEVQPKVNNKLCYSVSLCLKYVLEVFLAEP